jgi:hypothetical protein
LRVSFLWDLVGVLREILWKASFWGVFNRLLITHINKCRKAKFYRPQKPQASAKIPAKILTSESSFSLSAGRASIHQKVERQKETAGKALSAIAFGLPCDFRLDLVGLPFFQDFGLEHPVKIPTKP